MHSYCMLYLMASPCSFAQVDMSDEVDAFQAVASQCMNALVLGLNTRLDTSLQVSGYTHTMIGCNFTLAPSISLHIRANILDKWQGKGPW